VVIIGGGYGGVQMAADLKKAGIKFTIIEKKEYLHHCFAALRAAVNSGKFSLLQKC
jgi:2-polyprenyl-6-methoxyphenol hydroxylase-like FAD-dependent oxidoreductase